MLGGTGCAGSTWPFFTARRATTDTDAAVAKPKPKRCGAVRGGARSGATVEGTARGSHVGSSMGIIAEMCWLGGWVLVGSRMVTESSQHWRFKLALCREECV